MKLKKLKLIDFLFVVVLIILPAILGYFLLMRSWINPQKWISKHDWVYVIIGLSYIFYSFLITLIFWKLRIISIYSFQHTTPLSFVLGTIFIFDKILPLWGIALLTIPMCLSTFFVLILIEKYQNKKTIKSKFD